MELMIHFRHSHPFPALHRHVSGVWGTVCVCVCVCVYVFVCNYSEGVRVSFEWACLCVFMYEEVGALYGLGTLASWPYIQLVQ